MAVGRKLLTVVLIQTAMAGVCFADAYDSVSWRWNGWNQSARSGSNGFSLPYSLLSSVPYTPPSPAAWNIPAPTVTPTAIYTRPEAESQASPVASPVVRVVSPAVVPTPTPAVAAPISYSLPAAASASPGYGSPAGTGVQWNYGTTFTSLATVMSGANSNGGPTYNAYLNMGAGTYASAKSVTSGGAQPWYLSPAVAKLYGGVPTPDQQLQFTQTVLARVESTYHNSGLDVNLTTSPSGNAQHTLSVVSGTSSPVDPSAIGMTTVGQNGFSFIDKLSYATSVDQLEWAVAHNVAHELTHAFGIDGHDPTGNYLDAAITPWSTLIDPSATLSPGMISSLKSTNFGTNLTSSSVAAQELALNATSAASVPEPATYLTWALAAFGIGAWARKNRKAQAVVLS